MTNVLDPQLLEREQAADGRFFYEENPELNILDVPEHPRQRELYLAESGFAYTYCFWLANRDSTDFAAGPIVEQWDENRRTTVYLDDERWREPVFSWKIVQDDAATGETSVSSIESTPYCLSADKDSALALEELLAIMEAEPVKAELANRQRQHDWRKSEDAGLIDVGDKLEELAEARTRVAGYAWKVIARQQHGSIWHAGPSNDYASPLDRQRRDLRKAASFLEPSLPPPASKAPEWTEQDKQALLARMAELRASQNTPKEPVVHKDKPLDKLHLYPPEKQNLYELRLDQVAGDYLAKALKAKDERGYYRRLFEASGRAHDSVSAYLADKSFRENFTQALRGGLLPDGAFEIAGELYFKDETGLYVWSEDVSGREKFLTLINNGTLQTQQASRILLEEMAERVNVIGVYDPGPGLALLVLGILQEADDLEAKITSAKQNVGMAEKHRVDAWSYLRKERLLRSANLMKQLDIRYGDGTMAFDLIAGYFFTKKREQQDTKA